MFLLLNLLVFIPCVCVVISVTVIGNCSTSPPEQFEVSGDRRYGWDCVMYTTEGCRHGLLPSHLEGPSAERPGSVDVDGDLIPDGNHLSPQMAIEWTAPDNAENLKGYRISIRKYDIRRGTYTDICRVFDLSAARFDPKLRFKKHFAFPGGKNFYYRAEVHSLPHSPWDGEVIKYFSLQARHRSAMVPEISNENMHGHVCPDVPTDELRMYGPRCHVTHGDRRPIGIELSGSDHEMRVLWRLSYEPEGHTLHARDWTPFSTYDGVNYTEPATLSVRFKLAGRHYGFKNYRVFLVSMTDKNNYVSHCNVSTETSYICDNRTFQPPDHNDSSVEVAFPDVQSGKYYIQIQPVDPYLQDDDKCACHKYVNDERECMHCTAAQTATFRVSDAPPAVTEQVQQFDKYTRSTPHGNPVSTKPIKEGQRQEYVVLAIVGCVLAAVLIFVVLLCWKKGRNGKPKEKGLLPLNNTHIEDPNGKSILLLNTEDHDHHKSVTTAFAFYLNNYCRIKVHYLPWAKGQTDDIEKIEWVKEKMESADFVIVVNSRIAYTTYQSRMGVSSVFNFAISHMKANYANRDYFQKYNFINFDYTGKEHCIKDFNPSKQYTIPASLTDLLENICGESENHLNKISDSREGIALLEAITRARCYEETNPNWYEHRHHEHHSDSEEEQELLESEHDVGESGTGEYINAEHVGRVPSSFPVEDPSENGTGLSTEGVEEELYQITRIDDICNRNTTFNPPTISEISSNTAMKRLVDINVQNDRTNTAYPTFLGSAYPTSLGTVYPTSLIPNTTRGRDVVTQETTTPSDTNLTDVDVFAPSVSGVSDASTGKIYERFGEINRQCDHANPIRGNSEFGRPPHWNDSKTSWPISVRDDRSDVSSFWKPPSAVDSDATANASVIMNQLNSINIREHMNRASASVEGSVSQNGLTFPKLPF